MQSQEVSDQLGGQIIGSETASTMDIEGKIKYATSAFSKISGYSKEELMSKKHSIFMHTIYDKESFTSISKAI